MNRVEIDFGSDFVCHLANLFDWVDSSSRIGCTANRDKFGFVVQLVSKILKVKHEIVGPIINKVDFDSSVLGRHRPRRDVGIVIKSSNDDFVSGAPCPGKRTRESECKRGHVLPEHNFIAGTSANEIGMGLVALFQQLVAKLAYSELTVQI